MIITINDDSIINKKDFLDTIIKLPPSAKEVSMELKPVSINNDSSALGNINERKRKLKVKAIILFIKSTREKNRTAVAKIIPDKILDWNKISEKDLK